MTITHSLLSDLEREAALTLKVLQAVPESRFDYRPHEKSWSMAALAGHLAENPMWAHGFLEDEMDFAQLDDYRPFVPKDKQELLATLDKNLAACRDSLDKLDDDAMRATWTARMGDKVVQAAPREQVVRDILIHHQVQHRGQLQVYLRLCGAPVPPTYGPTADVPDWS